MTHTNTEGLSDAELLHKQLLRLAVSMAREFYPEVPEFRPLEDALGLLSQIDNMTTGLSRRAANSAGGVEVKALEWSEDRVWRYEATCAFGRYTAYLPNNGGPWFLTLGRDRIGEPFATVDETKAAAQVDFCQRILSAISIAVEAEPVAWRWRYTGLSEEDHIWNLTISKPDARNWGTHVHGGEEVQPLYTHPSSSVSAEVTGERVERLARFIAQDIFGNSWDGQGAEGRCTDRGFKPFHFSMHGGMRCQGTQNDLRDVARAALAALNGGRENG